MVHPAGLGRCGTIPTSFVPLIADIPEEKTIGTHFIPVEPFQCVSAKLTHFLIDQGVGCVGGRTLRFSEVRLSRERGDFFTGCQNRFGVKEQKEG